MKLARFAVTFVLIRRPPSDGTGHIAPLSCVPACGMTVSASRQSGPIESLQQTLTTPAQRSYVYDRNGKLMTTLFDVDRAPVKLSAVPKQLQEAVIAIEDRKFYQHNGVDLAGMFRAFTRDAGSGRLEQGASTITQQLVKNVWRRNEKRDFKEKMKEAWLAIQLESKLTKSEILEHYLNFVPFGNNAFGRRPRRSATSTSRWVLSRWPSPRCSRVSCRRRALDPITHPAERPPARPSARRDAPHPQDHGGASAAATRCRCRRTLRTRRARSAATTSTRCSTSSSTPIRRIPRIRRTCSARPPPRRTPEFVPGRLRIYTNYDPVMQYTADLAISGTIPKNQDQFTATLVSIDNSNGAVRAVAFGRGYSASQFDPAVDGRGRQAGSSFKAITLAAALSAGYSPDDRVPAYSIHWQIGPGDNYYNLSGDCHGGDPTLTQAIAKSDNCAFVRTELSTGPGPLRQRRRPPGRGDGRADGDRHFALRRSARGLDHARHQRRAPARDGAGVLGDRGRRRAAPRAVRVEDRRSARQGHVPQRRARKASAHARGRPHRDADAHRRAEERHRRRPEHRPPGGGQDRHDRQERRRLVHRVHAPADDRGVDGRPARRELDEQRRGISVFGATYPADIWKAFMEAAHTNVPVVDFIAPDENQWPTPQRIDEYGRQYRARTTGAAVASDDPDDDRDRRTGVRAGPTTTPPIVSPTTSPPPVTKPPVTKPPKPNAGSVT